MNQHLEEFKKGWRESGSIYRKGGALQHSLRLFILIDIYYQFILRHDYIPKRYWYTSTEFCLSGAVIYLIACGLSVLKTRLGEHNAKSRGDEPGSDC